MKFISAIPARSGSKGLKNKNILKINNKPLISYTFNAAKNSKIKKNYVLTDSKKIKNIANKYKINTEYIRPKLLSGDKVSIFETLHHFYKWTETNNIYFDYLVILQPTSPLRTSKDINNALKIVKKYKPKSLFSVSSSLEHPYETINIINNNKWKFVMSRSTKFFRRQDYNLKSFFINGAIYIAHKSLIIKKKTYNHNNHRIYLMPKSKSLEINDKEEFNIIKSILKKKI